MTTSTLLFNLLAGALGAVAVWLLVRALCARFAAGPAVHTSSGIRCS